MKSTFFSLFTFSFIIAAGSGTGCNGNDDPADAAAQLQWYTTCGDPVCSSYNPDPGATICTTETEGSACATAGDECVIANDDCNAHLLCTDSDPAVNCPISRARFKRQISYLDADQRDQIVQHLLATRLATYRYHGEPDSAPPRLGFIIDDQPQSQAVLPSGERVDLYGYTSMTVAAIQAQAAQIDALQQEIARLRQQVEALTSARP